MVVVTVEAVKEGETVEVGNNLRAEPEEGVEVAEKMAAVATEMVKGAGAREVEGAVEKEGVEKAVEKAEWMEDFAMHLARVKAKPRAGTSLGCTALDQTSSPRDEV